jgi:cell division protein FtsX
VIGLATRLSIGTGREALVRLVLTALGIALATAMLLGAAVVLPALQAHDERRGWMETREENRQPAQDESTTDPLLWRTLETRFRDRDLLRVDVAAEGPDAPLPPGLDALPGPGELAVSPALAELLERTDPALLADRFPGEVTATVGRDALVAPDDLTVFVGRTPEELRSEPEVLRVRSIEGAPFSRTLTRVMRLAVAVGGVGLLAPVVVFVATATRLAAARRERRLAAMRLAGATPRQIGVVAAVEAALAATAGVAAGFGLFLAVRPSLARIPFDGARFFPSDLRLSWVWAVVVGLGVPLLAATTAVVSLRRARISPLGVTRRAPQACPSPRPLVLVAVGMATLVVTSTAFTGLSDVAAAAVVGFAFLVMIAGIVLSGPWLTALVGRGLAWTGRGAPSLLAARRLQDNPAAGFRAIGGLTLAVFVGTVFSSFAASVLAGPAGSASPSSSDRDGMAPGVVAAALSPVLPPMPDGVPPSRQGDPAPPEGAHVEWPELAPAREAQIVRDLGAVAGVRRVVTAHALPDDPDVRTTLIRSVVGLDPKQLVMSCRDVAAIGIGACPWTTPDQRTAGAADGTTVVSVGGGAVEPTGIDVGDAVGVDALDDLPVVAFAAVTDGNATAIEAARTQLERDLPGSRAVTQADLDAEDQATARTTQRVSDIALAVTLVIAGCSLAVAVAGSIVERRQPFALLRLAGTRLPDLRRVVLVEAAAPLLMVAVATAGLGLAVTAVALAADSTAPPFTLPSFGYWMSLAGGLAVALGVVAATLPLLSRLTSPESVRFE